jgi:hypothetical protein
MYLYNVKRRFTIDYLRLLLVGDGGKLLLRRIIRYHVELEGKAGERKGKLNEWMNMCVRVGHSNLALAPRPSLIYCAFPFINPLLILHFG